MWHIISLKWMDNIIAVNITTITITVVPDVLDTMY